MATKAWQQFVRLMPRDSSDPDVALAALVELSQLMKAFHATKDASHREALLNEAIVEGEQFMAALLGCEPNEVWETASAWGKEVEAELLQRGYRVARRRAALRRHGEHIAATAMALIVGVVGFVRLTESGASTTPRRAPMAATPAPESSERGLPAPTLYLPDPELVGHVCVHASKVATAPEGTPECP